LADWFDVGQAAPRVGYQGMGAGREQDKDKPWVAKLVKAYHSEEIRQFIQTQFKGAVIAGF